MQCPARKIMGAGIHVNDIFPCIIRVNIVTANQTTPWQKKSSVAGCLSRPIYSSHTAKTQECPNEHDKAI